MAPRTPAAAASPQSRLVIVESPAKARTIERFLGSGYRVTSSIGHVRDLPAKAAEVPKNLKGASWATLAVNIEDDFTPLYIIPTDRKDVVAQLRRQLKTARELVLATDEDREGEAIAWHLVQVLEPRVPVRRLVFHEITRPAIQHALEHPRGIDEQLVRAQESRRVLDRLIGYLVSPVLWKKVRSGLSAGRVQTPALRLIVDRERERMAFVSGAYWSLTATLGADESSGTFEARLVRLAERDIAAGDDFDASTGAVKEGRNVTRLDEAAAQRISETLARAEFRTASVERRPQTRRPPPPFITSTLQQAASGRLRFNARRTMQVAQQLYENGYITYMRTDSPALSQQAVDAARADVRELAGGEYLPERPRRYRASAERAQEAHEAIRPAGEHFRRPDDLGADVSAEGRRLYELIWRRTLASQMRDAQLERTRVLIEADAGADGAAVFQANGQVVLFDGFLRLYASEGARDSERALPQLAEDQLLRLDALEPTGHETRPPDRWTEASLIRELERLSIGRPSTYAAILDTIDTKYVVRKGSALVPQWHAFAVIQLMTSHFPELVDAGFTARMEDGLDQVAAGDLDPLPWLRAFYFGSNGDASGDASGAVLREGLERRIDASQDAIDARKVCTIPLADGKDSSFAVRVGRYGPYLEAPDRDVRAPVPDDVEPDQLTAARAADLIEQAARGDQPLGVDPASGLPVLLRDGRLGRYLQLGESRAGGKRPKTASVWPTIPAETITLDQALKLLAYPRLLGAHPDSGTPVTVQDGPYGPYVKCGKENRSLPGEGDARYDCLASIELPAALALLQAPRQRRRSQPSAPLAELGAHPSSGAPLVVRDGRFGPYVTDGELNATVPRGRDPASLTLDEAVDLLAARAARVAAGGGRRRPRARRSRRSR